MKNLCYKIYEIDGSEHMCVFGGAHEKGMERYGGELIPKYPIKTHINASMMIVVNGVQDP